MDSLVNKNNRKAIYMALENLPKGIGDTYDEAMERIRAQNPDDKELGENVLLWISFALRPLSIVELQHALAVDDTTTNTDLDALPDEEIIISVCAGLVTIDNESSTVRLVRMMPLFFCLAHSISYVYTDHHQTIPLRSTLTVLRTHISPVPTRLFLAHA